MREPKQERAIHTRAAIVRAAAEVFDEAGYSGASIKKIITLAGVTQGAMYFHFASKEDLARTVMIEQGDDLKLPDGPPGLQRLVDVTMYLGDQLRHNRLLRAGVRLAVEQGDFFAAGDDTAYRQWAERFAEDLYVARAHGDLRADLNVPEFAQFLVGAYSGTQLFSQISTGRADLQQRLLALWRYLLPGIATAQGMEKVRVQPWREHAAR